MVAVEGLSVDVEAKKAAGVAFEIDLADFDGLVVWVVEGEAFGGGANGGEDGVETKGVVGKS